MIRIVGRSLTNAWILSAVRTRKLYERSWFAIATARDLDGRARNVVFGAIYFGSTVDCDVLDSEEVLAIWDLGRDRDWEVLLIVGLPLRALVLEWEVGAPLGNLEPVPVANIGRRIVTGRLRHIKHEGTRVLDRALEVQVEADRVAGVHLHNLRGAEVVLGASVASKGVTLVWGLERLEALVVFTDMTPCLIRLAVAFDHLFENIVAADQRNAGSSGSVEGKRLHCEGKKIGARAR